MAKIILELHGNNSMLSVHLKHRFIDNHFIDEKMTAEKLESHYTQIEVFEGTVALSEALSALPGVTGLSIWPYYIRIEKAKAYDWIEIVPVVLDLLSSVIGYEVKEDEIEAIDGRPKREYIPDGDWGGHSGDRLTQPDVQLTDKITVKGFGPGNVVVDTLTLEELVGKY